MSTQRPLTLLSLLHCAPPHPTSERPRLWWSPNVNTRPNHGMERRQLVFSEAQGRPLTLRVLSAPDLVVQRAGIHLILLLTSL